MLAEEALFFFNFRVEQEDVVFVLIVVPYVGRYVQRPFVSFFYVNLVDLPENGVSKNDCSVTSIGTAAWCAPCGCFGGVVVVCSVYCIC